MDFWSAISHSFSWRKIDSTFLSTISTDTSGIEILKCERFFIVYVLTNSASRLTIPYAFVILSIIYINPYMPKGPLSIAYGLGAQNCRDYWWVNLLYMNDFIHQDKQVWTAITTAVDLVLK